MMDLALRPRLPLREPSQTSSFQPLSPESLVSDGGFGLLTSIPVPWLPLAVGS
jgi:hypothetical protein